MKIGTSGWESWKRFTPSGAATRQTNLIDWGFFAAIRVTASEARLPVASTSSFRQLLVEISMLLAYEVTRDLPLVLERIETPVAPMDAPLLDGKKVVLVSILRAGNGILDGMLKIWWQPAQVCCSARATMCSGERSEPISRPPHGRHGTASLPAGWAHPSPCGARTRWTMNRIS